MKKETIIDKRGFVYTQNEKSVTMEIRGKAWRNLKKMSDILNKYGQGWEASPIELLNWYIMGWAVDQLVPSQYDQSACGMMLSACRDDNDPERTRMLDEIEKRFKAAGLSTFC